MKKKLVLLVVALLALPLGMGSALAGKGENSTGSEGKPCSADHGHPFQNGKSPCTQPPPTTTADPCSAAAGDEGLTGGGTIAQQAYDGGLSALPVVQDPDADGPISSQIRAGGDGQPVEPLTDEVACLVNLPVTDL